MCNLDAKSDFNRFNDQMFKTFAFLSFYSTKIFSQNKGRFSNELCFCGYCRAFTRSSKRGNSDPKRAISRDFCGCLGAFWRFLQGYHGYSSCAIVCSSILAFAKVSLTICHYFARKSCKINQIWQENHKSCRKCGTYQFVKKTHLH